MRGSGESHLLTSKEALEPSLHNSSLTHRPLTPLSPHPPANPQGPPPRERKPNTPCKSKSPKVNMEAHTTSSSRTKRQAWKSFKHLTLDSFSFQITQTCKQPTSLLRMTIFCPCEGSGNEKENHSNKTPSRPLIPIYRSCLGLSNKL